MPKFHKHKLLFDENMPNRRSFPRLNELFDVKHIRDDLNNAGMADPQVFSLAAKLKRLLVTYNIKDFRSIATQNQNTGVIGISPHLQLHQIDAKLTALLFRSSEKVLLGKYTSLSEAA
jgi:predicted nuclease of predicted toxin-antitoxin system